MAEADRGVRHARSSPTLPAVIVRERGGSSIPEAIVIESRSRGVLDRPLSRATTVTMQRLVIPGRCEASNPESRDSPMCNCTPEVRVFDAPRNDVSNKDDYSDSGAVSLLTLQASSPAKAGDPVFQRRQWSNREAAAY